MGKGTQTTSNQTTSSPNPQAASAYTDLLTRAGQVASTPYQAYTGELTAPINAQQTAGINNINANAGFAQPYIQQAAGLVSGAANPLTASQIQQYQNPYTQQVVNATQAAFNNQNQQQQASLTGNNISQGALGGNRVGVAQANLAGQQSAAQAPVIAGLYNTGYQNALQTAQQQFQTNPMSAAYSLGNLGVSGQTAALSGAGAQVGAGTLQQTAQQAADTAQYQQFMQQQAYPFQTAQWLAGIDTGVGSQLGGTSTGTSTAPAPNQWAQYAGLGLSAAGLFLKNGGAVPGFADGGTISGTPYGGAPSWIPQINIHGGSGAPHASTPGVANTGSAPQVDPSKIIATANQLSSRLSGPAWGGGSFWGGDAYGGSSSSPLEGLTAADYGAGFAKGGQVPGFAAGGGPEDTSFLGVSNADPSWANPDVGPGYAMPPEPAAGFAARFGNLPPAREDPGFVDAYQKIVGQDPRAYANDVPMPSPRPSGAPSGAPVAAQDDEAEDRVTPTAGLARPVAPPTVGDGGPSAPVPGFAAAARPQDEGVGWSISRALGYPGISSAAKTGLLAAGLGMLASRSPNLGNAIGEGGIQGLNAYSGAISNAQKAELEQRRVDLEADRLAKDAERAAKDLELRTAAQQETASYHKGLLEKEFKPTYGVVREDVDPETGVNRKVYGWIDPNTKKATPETSVPAGAPPPAPKVDKDGLPLTGQEYLDTLPPNRATLAKQIADYKVNPAGLSIRGGHREQAIADATRYNPDYDQRFFSGSSQVMKNFMAGPESRTVRSLNVAIDHLSTLDEAAKAMNNSDYPTLNRIVNAYRQQTGSPLATNFDSIKQVVSAEIAKAVVGGQTALHDRDDMAQRASNASSPEQLMGITQEFRKLMAGQMNGLRKTYESSNLKNFDQFLEPATKKALESVGGKGGEGGASTAPPPNASEREINRIYTTPKGQMRWTGQGWVQP